MRVRPLPTTSGNRRRRLVPLATAAALTVSLACTGGAAFAAMPTATPASASAFADGELLPDYELDVLGQMNADNAYEHVRQLAVEIGPRVTGTPGELAGVEYATAQLEAMGFTVERQEFPVSLKRVAMVTSDTATLEGGPNWQLSVAPTSVFTGEAAPITAPVIDVGAGTEPMPASAVGALVLANNPSATAARTALVDNAIAAGAVGVILVNTAANTSPPAVTVTGTKTVPVIGGGGPHADRMRALLAEGPLSLTVMTSEYSAPGYNAIGTLPAHEGGDDAPIVFVTAHIDSVLGSPGANDDASGTGVALEVARVMSQYPLDTEIRVGLWGGEESGLLGSKYYAANMSQHDVDRTVGVWQMDMVGTPYTEDVREWKFWGHSANGASNIVLETANSTFERAGFGTPNNGRMTGSDHVPFFDRGIAAAVFSWMYWAPPSSYGLEPAYHRPSDTMENVSAEKLLVAAQVVGASAFRAAANELTVTVTGPDGTPAAGAEVILDCGDGLREVGTTNADGALITAAPHVKCWVAAVGEAGTQGSVSDFEVLPDSTVAIEMLADTAAPVVTLGSTPGSNAFGWNNAEVTVDVAAEDDTESMPSIEARVDGGAFAPYVEPFVFAEEGEYLVEAFASDTAGNQSDPVELGVNIDLTLPIASATFDAKARTVTVTATDALSGIDAVEYRLSGSAAWTAVNGTIAIAGAATTVEYRASDRAGNVSAVVGLRVPAAAGSGSDLAATGVEDAGLFAGLGVLLVLLGAGVVATRRARAGAERTRA